MAFLEKYEIKKNVNEYEMNKKNKMIHMKYLPSDHLQILEVS